ncbi:acylneuraminate cytidylyltransferase family protein [Synechococcus sp. M16CYN]|uniref:acylneuraminate cytidylyltransferase family protein n=1 Tax=Synechococcus sp. M16CYN TaxID=3103139 RepID=UPI00324DA494
MVANVAALALIPARGGSKGIPAKNLQKVGGISLVARCIHAAQASDRVTRIVVSTDDQDIAAVSQATGVDFIKRPENIADDLASSESVLLHALEELVQYGPLEANLVLLQCTSPFTTGKQIDKVLTALDQSEFNSSFAVAPWHGFLWRVNGEGINHDPGVIRQRRQDLEPSYIETGAIYAMRTTNFRATGRRFCPPWKPVVIPDMSPEIDTPEDLALCQSLAFCLYS